jgi:hypothetical protein
VSFGSRATFEEPFEPDSIAPGYRELLRTNDRPPPPLSGPKKAWRWIVQSATGILASLSPSPFAATSRFQNSLMPQGTSGPQPAVAPSPDPRDGDAAK